MPTLVLQFEGESDVRAGEIRQEVQEQIGDVQSVSIEDRARGHFLVVAEIGEQGTFSTPVTLNELRDAEDVITSFVGGGGLLGMNGPKHRKTFVTEGDTRVIGPFDPDDVTLDSGDLRDFAGVLSDNGLPRKVYSPLTAGDLPSGRDALRQLRNASERFADIRADRNDPQGEADWLALAQLAEEKMENGGGRSSSSDESFPEVVFNPQGEPWQVVETFREADELTIQREDRRDGITRMAIASGEWNTLEMIQDFVAEALKDSPEVDRTTRDDAVQLIRSRSKDTELSDNVDLEFIIESSLKDAGVPREDRIAIQQEAERNFVR
jgi:hypothetical protein